MHVHVSGARLNSQVDLCYRLSDLSWRGIPVLEGGAHPQASDVCELPPSVCMGIGLGIQ